MTETLQELDRRIESARELHTLTRTMRGLAAVNLRGYELAAEATDRYEAIIEDGLQIALREGRIDRLPKETSAADAPTAMIVFGSNQGLCGPINRHVALHAAARAETVPALALVGAVGGRLAAELDLTGLTPDTSWELPATIEAIPARAEHLVDQAERWKAASDVRRVLLVFPHFRGRGRGYEPVTLQILPTDRDWLEWLAIRNWPSTVLPTFAMPWDELVTALLHQALFVRIHRSFAQTMAAVAASRLSAMDNAQRNIEERLSSLHVRYHKLRHSEITKELLDVVSGFELLGRQDPERSRNRPAPGPPPTAVDRRQ